MDQFAAAIFVKTPGKSPVKTRLAKKIGEKKAEEFYRLSLNSLTELFKMEDVKAEIKPYFAVAEKDALSEWKDFETIWQGDGELGNRLHHVYSQLLEKHPRGVILIGADSPQISSEHLHSCIQQIEEEFQNLVIGPAHDGGFYLFASNYPFSENFWTKIPYSQSDTLEKLYERIPKTWECTELPPLSDVDQVEDLKELEKEMVELEANRSAVQKIKKWLEDNPV